MERKRQRSFVAAVLLTLVPLTSVPLAAGAAAEPDYRPQGLHDLRHVVLDNGLQLLLKRRDGARNVALRLVVGVGTEHFPCGRRETPHFLEHLLFAGTSAHDETELDALMESNGGWWNAQAGDRQTTYEVGIFSGYWQLALSLLHEMVTDSQLAPEDVEITRDIINREAGGRPSRLRRWLYRNGVGKSGASRAYEYLFPGDTYFCGELETPDAVTRDDLLQALRQWYLPGRMLMVMVGDFDEAEALALVRDTFGALPAGGAPAVLPVAPPAPLDAGERLFTGLLHRLVGDDVETGLVFRVPGDGEPEEWALGLLASYLDTRLFNELRVRRGLSYAPGASYYADGHYGAFRLQADVDAADAAEARALMLAELEDLGDGEVDVALLEHVRRSLLLGFAQGLESNGEIADYYVSRAHELREGGRFVAYVPRVQAVTAKDVAAVGRVHLAPHRAVRFEDAATLGWTALYLLVASLSGALVLGCGLWLRRQARSRSVRRQG